MGKVYMDLPYKVWRSLANKYAKEKYHVEQCIDSEDDSWRDYYNDGYSPRDAIDEDMDYQ